MDMQRVWRVASGATLIAFGGGVGAAYYWSYRSEQWRAEPPVAWFWVLVGVSVIAAVTVVALLTAAYVTGEWNPSDPTEPSEGDRRI